MNEVVDIELLDIVIKLAKRWKNILLLGILGAVIGIAFCFLRGGAITQTSSLSPKEQMEKNIQEASASLSEDEISNVKSNYSIYKTLTQQRQVIQQYLESSKYFHLQPGEAVTLEMSYVISGNDSLGNVFHNIEDMIGDEEVLTHINEQLMEPINAEDFSNMLSFDAFSADSTSDNAAEPGLKKTEDSVFKLTVDVDKKENGEIIKTCIEERIAAMEKELTPSYPGLKIQKLLSAYKAFQLKELMDKYSVYTDTINKINTNISSLNSSMTEPERSFYQVLMKNSDEGVEEEKDVKIPQRTIAYKQIIKYAFVFMVFLPMLYAFFFVCRYILDGRLHNERVLSKQLGIPVLCHMEEGDASLALREMKYLARKNPNGKIGLLSSSNHPQMRKVLGDLLDQAGGEDGLILLNSHLENRDDLDKLDSVQSLIFVENEEVSKIKEIIEATNYYKNKQIPILGAIMVK